MTNADSASAWLIPCVFLVVEGRGGSRSAPGGKAGGLVFRADHDVLGLLTIGRLAHAQGLSGSPGTSVGRLVGMTLTWGAIAVGAVAAIVSYAR